MHAIQSKCHANCLCNFYSKLRTIEKQNKNYNESSIIYNIVLSEVVNFIKKTLKTSQTAPAFILSDLKQMFLKAYQRYTGTSIDLHSTRLKEKLISKLPGLQAHRCGKQVILRRGEVTTEAVLAALSYSDDDDSKALVQTAKLIRQDLLNNENKFKFNFDKDSQKNDVREDKRFTFR